MHLIIFNRFYLAICVLLFACSPNKGSKKPLPIQSDSLITQNLPVVPNDSMVHLLVRTYIMDSLQKEWEADYLYDANLLLYKYIEHKEYENGSIDSIIFINTNLRRSKAIEYAKEKPTDPMRFGAEKVYTYKGKLVTSEWVSRFDLENPEPDSEKTFLATEDQKGLDDDEGFEERVNPVLKVADTLNLLTRYLRDIDFVISFCYQPVIKKSNNNSTYLIYKKSIKKQPSDSGIIPFSRFFNSFGGLDLESCTVELNSHDEILSNTFVFNKSERLQKKGVPVIVKQSFEYKERLPYKITTLTEKDGICVRKVVQFFDYVKK